MKVKAGVRLLMAEARVGELSSIPLYEHIIPKYLSQKEFDQIKMVKRKKKNFLSFLLYCNLYQSLEK